MSRLAHLTAVTLVLVCVATPALAQAPGDTSPPPLPLGTWTGTLTGPEGTPTFDARYHVRMRGDEIRMSVRTDAFELGFSDVRVEGDRLLFSFTDAPVVRCTVTLTEDGSYRGGCVDPGGDAEVVVMIPPTEPAPDLPDTPPARRHILGLPGMSGEVETAAGVLPAPYSRAVQVGATLYLSGYATGRYVGPEGTTEVEAAEREARRVLEQMKAALDLADMTMADLVYVQVFATDLGDYDAFNRVYREYFADEFPARAFLGVATLLGDSRFEVQAIAVER